MGLTIGQTIANGWQAASNRVLDPSIVFSFDQTGFDRHRTEFGATDLDVDMTGRTCLVTGANSGIGFATAMGLAVRGATVWMLCRNRQRGEFAAAEIRALTKNPNVVVAQVDLSDFGSIDRFVVNDAPDVVDVLVNNAGVLLSSFDVAASGLEMTLATNLVGPLRLTASLMPRLRAGDRSRMIWVSSGGMYAKKLHMGDLERPPWPFDGVSAYAQTKRAMVVLNELLADRMGGPHVATHCMHPGWADTPGVERSIPNFWRLTKGILRSPDAGSDTILWLAVCDRAHAKTGQFWFDRKARRTHFLPTTRADPRVRETFWMQVHEWAGISPLVWRTQ